MADAMNTHAPSRRGFLGGAALLASAGLPAASFAATSTPGDIKLGVASYSFRKKSAEEAVAGCKALGVRYLNVKNDFHLKYGSSPEQISAFKKLLDDNGITLVGTGNTTMRKPDEADIRAKFEFNKAMGSPMMVIAPSLESLPVIEKMVKEYNIPVAIHNHGPEDKDFFPSPYDVLKAVKNMDPRVGLCMDIGHSTRAGADIVKAAKDAGPRLLDMHTKDLKDGKDAKSQVAVGDGILPIAALFRQLEKQGYKGYVNLEYEIEADNPMPGMQKSFSYMRGVAAGLKA